MKTRKRAAVAITAAVALIAAGAVSTAQPAYAAPDWYEDSPGGMMVHWGLTTGAFAGTPCDSDPSTLPFDNAADFEAATAAASWSPDPWVEATQSLHADYIVVAAFHSQEGYLRIWPSSVPGSPSTTRDFLQETIDAAAESGIKVVMYITSDPSRAYDGGCDWLDEDAYATYKSDPSVDIHTSSGFAKYSYDVVDELLTDYPDLGGFWFDGWAPDWTPLGIVSNIHTKNPDAAVIANDFGRLPQFGEDVQSLEAADKYPDPNWDHPSSAWVPPNGAETVYAFSDWMYYNSSANHPRSEPQFESKWVASIAGTGWTPLAGLPTKLDGSFPTGINDQLDFIDSYRDWADPALIDTVAGGYDFGIQPGTWNNGAYGTVTSSADGTEQYLHVLAPPVGDTAKWDGTAQVAAPELGAHTVGTKKVVVDVAGDTWAIDTLDRIWREQSGTWARVPGFAQDLATGADGSVWRLTFGREGASDGYAEKWNGSGWTLVGGSGVQIAVDGNGHQWVLQSSGNVIRWNGTGWDTPFTGAQDIASGSDGSIWLIGPPAGSANGEIFKWNGTNFGTGHGGGMTISVDNAGDAWFTNSLGQVWSYNDATISATYHTAGAADVSATFDGRIYVHGEAPTSISVPDSGWTVSSATDLRTSNSLTRTQTGGVLTVEVDDWSTHAEFGDQIIKLTAGESSRLYPRNLVTATATAFDAGGGPGANAADSNYSSWWHTTTAPLPQGITLETATTQTVAGLRVAQQEFSPIGDGGYHGPDPERIRAAVVEVSSDGVNFTTVWSGELLNQRGAQVIPFTPASADYVRLTALSNWGGSNVVQIASMDILTD